MRAREGSVRKPCHFCGDPTVFELRHLCAFTRGGPKWVACCVECGERPARRLEVEGSEGKVSGRPAGRRQAEGTTTASPSEVRA